MDGVGSILVIDGSATARQTLRTLLVPHCRRVLTASNAAEGLRALDTNDSIGLVLCDAVLPAAGAFEVLAHAGAGGPRVILVSPWWIPADAARAEAEGAAGYLVRPISLRDVARLWKATHHGLSGLTPRMERRPLAKVWLLDDADRVRYVISWDLYDISLTGAFIETRGPLPLGSELPLEIIFGKQVVRLSAEVVRVQEPSWMHVGGVGVRFLEMDADSRGVLEEFVHQSVVVTGG